jgi:hypothetical protein
VSQIVRIGPQDQKKPISLNPGDTLEVALPEKAASGTWKVDFDRGLLWDEEEDAQQGRWVLGGALQQTVRTFLALAKGTFVLHCEYVDLRNGQGQVLENLEFTVFIGMSPAEMKKFRRPPENASPRTTSSPPRQRQMSSEPPSVVDHTFARIQHLETENRRLQERLWTLTNRVVQLAEDYASIVKRRPAQR